MGIYKNTHIKKHINWTGVVIASIFAIVFLIMAFPLFGVLHNLIVGFFGVLGYPASLLGVLIGLAVSLNRKFNMTTRNLIYLLATAFLFAALLHIIFSTTLIKSYGKVVFKNYVDYIITCGTLSSGVTIGGGFMAIFVYPFAVLFGVVGSYVVFSVALCLMIGLTLDYYLVSGKNRKKNLEKNQGRTLPDSALPANESIGSSLNVYQTSSKVVPQKRNDDEYTRFLMHDSSEISRLEDQDNFANKISTKTGKPIVNSPVNDAEKSLSKASVSALYGNSKLEDYQIAESLLVDDKAKMGYDPNKFDSLKQYITYPYVPPVFVKSESLQRRQPEEPKVQSNEQPAESDAKQPDQNDQYEDFYRRLGKIKETPIVPASNNDDLVGPAEDKFVIDTPEEEPISQNRDLPHTNPFSVDEIKLADENDIFDDDEESTLTPPPMPNRSSSNRMSRPSEQLFGDRRAREEAPSSPSRNERNFDSRSYQRPDRREENFDALDRVEPDNFGRTTSGRGPDRAQRKTPERNPRINDIRSNQNSEYITAPNPFANFGVTPPKSKAEQIELPVYSKSPFSHVGEKDVRYNPPPTTLLTNNSEDPRRGGNNFEEKGKLIEDVLESFRIPAKVVNVIQGPTFSRLELSMPSGIPVRRVLQYDSDIAMALKSKNGVRIEAPIPGKNAFGVEVPNEVRSTVGLRELLESPEFNNSSAILPIAVGKNIDGETVIASMSKMVHLLVAGSTGSGKSIFLHNLILSLMYKSSPDQLRFILIDPKRVEFNQYNGMPHLMLPNVVTECDKAINAFTWAVKEMDRRYKVFQENGTRDIESFNKSDAVKSKTLAKLPYIVIVVDELADLMTVGKREVEQKIQRLAQLGRACGIHLVIATQRPSVEVVTGTIKANIPTRIAFALASFVDSRTILDEGGAEKLLGKGDMLYSPQDASLATRLQSAYCESTDIRKVIDYIKSNNEIYFDEEIEKSIMTSKEEEDQRQSANGKENDGEGSDYDELLPEVLRYFIETNSASTSMIQRRFRVGYARAARILDEMEIAGYVSQANGSKARNVLITMEMFENIFGNDTADN